MLAQRAAAPQPLAAGREARARMLADEASALESERAAFLSRCAAFQTAHEPTAVAAQHAQAAAEADALQSEAAALQERARELRASSARAEDDTRAAEERNRELAATCAGAKLPRYSPVLCDAFAACFSRRLTRLPSALRDSVAAEAQTALALAAELAELDAPPPELAAATAEAAAARDSCADLDDAVAVQRMELERLRDEAQRADQYMLHQVRRFAELTAMLPSGLLLMRAFSAA